MKIWQFSTFNYLKGFTDYIRSLKKNNFFIKFYNEYKKIFTQENKKYLISAVFLTFIADCYYFISNLNKLVADSIFDISSKVIITLLITAWIKLNRKNEKESYITSVTSLKILLGTFTGSLIFILFKLIFPILLFLYETLFFVT